MGIVCASRRAMWLGSMAMCLAGWLPRPSWSATSVPDRVQVQVDASCPVPLLPLWLARQLGYFQEEGLDVAWHADGQPSLVSDPWLAQRVVLRAGSFDQVLQRQQWGQPEQVFLMLAQAPQVVMALPHRSGAPARGWPDLMGQQIGIERAGSMSEQVARLLLRKAGDRLDQVQLLPLSSPELAVQALKAGRVQAWCGTDPFISQLEAGVRLRLLADTRRQRDASDLLGGEALCYGLSASEEVLDRHAAVVQRVCNGVVRAIQWMHTASPVDLMLHRPPEWPLAAHSQFLTALTRARDTLSRDGRVPPQAAANWIRARQRLDPQRAWERLDPERTYTNRHVRLAARRFKV